MAGDEIEIVVCFGKHAAFPGSKRWHMGAGGAAGHEFQA